MKRPISRCLAALTLLATAIAGPAHADGEAPKKGDDKPPVVLESTPTAMIGAPAPALEASKWLGEATSWDELGDKVVLVTFWEVWSSGCRRLNRRLVKLHARYASKGLVIVAVHPQDNAERALARASAKKYPFRVMIDRERATARAYASSERVPSAHLVVKGKVAFAKIDTTVDDNLERAIEYGLAGDIGRERYAMPDRIAPPKVSTIRSSRTKPMMDVLGGKPAPALELDRWVGDASPLDKLRGKVVLIDFWGTWCPPCVAALPKMAALHEKYAEKGLVIIGVHSTNQGEGVEAWLAQREKDGDGPIPYPLAVDLQNKTIKAYRVSAFPTMVFVGRDGTVKRAFVGMHSDLDKVVEQLLAEKAQPAKTDEKPAEKPAEKDDKPEKPDEAPAKKDEEPAKRDDVPE